MRRWDGDRSVVNEWNRSSHARNPWAPFPSPWEWGALVLQKHLGKPGSAARTPNTITNSFPGVSDPHSTRIPAKLSLSFVRLDLPPQALVKTVTSLLQCFAYCKISFSSLPAFPLLLKRCCIMVGCSLNFSFTISELGCVLGTAVYWGCSRTTLGIRVLG